MLQKLELDDIINCSIFVHFDEATFTCEGMYKHNYQSHGTGNCVSAILSAQIPVPFWFAQLPGGSCWGSPDKGIFRNLEMNRRV